MCRMIAAAGRFDPERVLRAATRMSEGRTAEHGGPVRVHPDGWGMAFRDPGAPDGLRVHRDPAPLFDTWDRAPPPPATDFLAVHARHATRPETRGEAFCHPVTRPGTEVPWLLFHNGYLPTVCRQLGRPAGGFDTADLFDYLVPRTGFALDRQQVLDRLAAVEPSGSAANAILVNPRRAYVLCWWLPGAAHTDFYRMFRADTAGATFVASERLPLLAPPGAWRPLDRGELIELPFTPFVENRP